MVCASAVEGRAGVSIRLQPQTHQQARQTLVSGPYTLTQGCPCLTKKHMDEYYKPNQTASMQLKSVEATQRAALLYRPLTATTVPLHSPWYTFPKVPLPSSSSCWMSTHADHMMPELDLARARPCPRYQPLTATTAPSTAPCTPCRRCPCPIHMQTPLTATTVPLHSPLYTLPKVPLPSSSNCL
jgi:hypothetical protein